MLHADPDTPFVPRVLSDLGGAMNDTRVFSETPVGSGFPAPAAREIQITRSQFAIL